MTTPTSLRGRTNVSRSLLPKLVGVSESKESDEKFDISALNMRKLLRWVAGTDNASSQQVVAVMRTRTESGGSYKLATIFAVAEELFLSKAYS